MKRQSTANRNLATPPPPPPRSNHRKDDPALPEKRPWSTPAITEMTIESFTMSGRGTYPEETVNYLPRS